MCHSSRTWSVVLLGLAMVALFAPGTARAGACCVGLTSTVPTRLGECETWLAGVGFSGELAMGRWDGAGEAVSSSLAERALLAHLGAGWRWARWGQLQVTAPFRINYRGAGDLEDWGTGPGDLRLSAIVSPYEERPATPGHPGVPRLFLTVGARLPTGTSWQQSASPLEADVTGLPGVSAIAGLSLERTVGRFPWSLSIDSELPLRASGTPPLLAASGSLGRSLGQSWSLATSLRYEYTLADAEADRQATSRTVAGLRLVHGKRLAWRSWLGADIDLPVDGLGRSNTRLVTIGAGVLVVR